MVDVLWHSLPVKPIRCCPLFKSRLHRSVLIHTPVRCWGQAWLTLAFTICPKSLYIDLRSGLFVGSHQIGKALRKNVTPCALGHFLERWLRCAPPLHHCCLIAVYLFEWKITSACFIDTSVHTEPWFVSTEMNTRRTLTVKSRFLTFSGQSLQDAAAGRGQISDGLPLLLRWICRLRENWEKKVRIHQTVFETHASHVRDGTAQCWDSTVRWSHHWGMLLCHCWPDPGPEDDKQVTSWCSS